MATIIRAASLVPVPWKNGGGITREIAVWPAGASMDAFAWRLSIAEVSRDGAFSTFPSVDRVLVLLDGAGMRLRESAGREYVLDKPLAMAHFAGESPIDATLENGPTRDFNVMVHRERARASVLAGQADGAATHDWSAAHDANFVFCATGRLSIAQADAAFLLGAGDIARFDGAAAITCQTSVDAGWLRIGIDLI
jgi:uncharacterized protein